MSFSASAKRARDPQQPLGARATCIHDCLDRFNLFGFTATRERLRAHLGATGQQWTEQQITDALALLEQARDSWLAFNRAEAEHHRTLKRQGQRTNGRNQSLSHLAWLQSYLRDAPAQTWQTTNLGPCPTCGHLQIHHNSRGCLACHWNGVTWEERCTTPIPSPNTNTKPVTRH